MANDNAQRRTARKLLNKLDETIEKGPWEKSVFLGAIGKKLKDIRFNFKNRLRFLDPGFEENLEEQPPSEAPQKTSSIVKQPQENQIEAFVSLYNVDGGNIQKWEKILLSLDKQIVTRPVYGTEKEIRAVMRSKVNRKNEAYAAFILDKENIIPPKDNKAPSDRLGNVLLILKDAALKIENITRFYHESGIYVLQDTVLSRIGDMDVHYLDS